MRAWPGGWFSTPDLGSLRIVNTKDVFSDTFQLRWLVFTALPFTHIGIR
jgi:hypothetical protein